MLMIKSGEIIEEDKLIYFKANRFFPNEAYYEGIKFDKRPKEIVSFDCALFDLSLVLRNEWRETDANGQIIAVVINPVKDKVYGVDENFIFCGYDLCDLDDTVSVLTNCGGVCDDVIDYSRLNDFGLIDDFDVAYQAKRLLQERAGGEEHSNCQIIKIWRRIPF